MNLCDKNQNKNIYSELVCFGEYEKSLHKKHIQMLRLFRLGSLTLTEYLNQKKNLRIINIVFNIRGVNWLE